MTQYLTTCQVLYHNYLSTVYPLDKNNLICYTYMRKTGCEKPEKPSHDFISNKQ